MKPPKHHEPFLRLAADGKERTASEIRDALDLAKTVNVTGFLHLLTMWLTLEKKDVRLKNRKTSGRGEEKLWWLEERRPLPKLTNVEWLKGQTD